ncbi:MAG: bifunctional pyr operon transcriptional regulator/uracil phosphoribosyltransferase PyrR [Candidatus Tectomicrobia bacterium]|uniref:Bifunctional protein PyrR n=1 Tax=Tectimicrobiota bacterium TaxID=2528274 RepID=A0A932CM11_UNCTE|nr:bifunctional pyr operon transcriptional regulator/uracil phosphoribosyltransferase PyrR [Candidatus Tectomicrobia bacterium]
MDQHLVMDEADIDRALTRIAHQILERNQGCQDLILMGIRSRGVPLAQRIAAKIGQVEGTYPPVGSLDITLYRDDLHRGIPHRHKLSKTEIPFSLTDKSVVLVDDVLFTGRTVRAALDALIDFGRPRLIWLAVLIDRGQRELPIQADFVGREVSTLRGELVKVFLQEMDREDKVMIRKEDGPER